MKKVTKRIIKAITQKYFWLILLLILVISYGQLLGMYVWQDDNGLFFKLAHISEKAGYLGPGPFGQGPYKYVVTPYIPIYQLFGYNTVPYFMLTWILYFVTTLVVLRVVTHILGKDTGRIVACLYGAGYIASDGYIRLFNSVITSVSQICILLWWFFYWKYYQTKSLPWYFGAVLLFLLAIELARARTHYLVATVIIFELLFLVSSRIPELIKNMGRLSTWQDYVLFPILRLVPFGIIFYHYFLQNSDQRTGQVGNLVKSLLRGDFSQTFSIVTSLTNVIIPDWMTNALLHVNYQFAVWGVFTGALIITYLLFRGRSRGYFFMGISGSLIIGWRLVINTIYHTNLLNPTEAQLFLAFLGGLLLILLLEIGIVTEKYRKIYIFLVSWMLINIAAYGAYSPTVIYESVNRYLAHSFLAWIIVLGVFYLASKRTIWHKAIIGLILVWGGGNLVFGAWYQHQIVANRSNPPRLFYAQLKQYVPQALKGDVFYFDVADDATGYFADAFSVASMPETTAIAWRYGIDRYDIKLFTNFTKLAQAIKQDPVPIKNIHTFWYSKMGLVDTTPQVADLIKSGSERKVFSLSAKSSEPILKKTPAGTEVSNPDIVIDIPETVSSVYPVELTLNIRGSLLNPDLISFPLTSSQKTDNPLFNGSWRMRDLAFGYLDYKENVLENDGYSVSSQWQDRVINNLHDGNTETIWQPDRLSWQKRNESLTIDLGVLEEVDRFIWINGFGNNTPTNYSISVSLDSLNWTTIKTVASPKRIDNSEPQIVKFPASNARFVRMQLTNSLNGDSPGISEAWVASSKFSDLDLAEAEKYFQNPFARVETVEDWANILVALKNRSDVQISWKNDKKSGWISDQTKKINVNFDDLERPYTLTIPAGGTRISQIKLSNITLPGNIIINSLAVGYLPLESLLAPK